MLGNLDNEIALRILYLICKIFYVSNQLKIAPFLIENGALNPWMLFFKQLLDQPIQDHFESVTENSDEIHKRDKSIQWKIKGLAAKITYRLFSKYANAKFVEEELKSFS